MKKIIFVCLLLICSFCIVGCSDNKVSISDSEKYIGTWYLVGVETYEGSKVNESIIRFNSDGTCHFSFSLFPENESAIGIEGISDGKCYLNKSGDKFKMEGYGSIFKEWTDFSENGEYLIINNWKYKKVDN